MEMTRPPLKISLRHSDISVFFLCLVCDMVLDLETGRNVRVIDRWIRFQQHPMCSLYRSERTPCFPSQQRVHPSQKKKKKKRSDKVEHTMLHCSEFRQQHLLVTNHTIYWVEKEFSEEKSKAKVFWNIPDWRWGTELTCRSFGSACAPGWSSPSPRWATPAEPTCTATGTSLKKTKKQYQH